MWRTDVEIEEMNKKTKQSERMDGAMVNIVPFLNVIHMIENLKDILHINRIIYYIRCVCLPIQVSPNII